MRNAQEINFNNYQGVNCVDNNVVLPAHQVPFAFNVDFGRQIGAASKRYGLESLITPVIDLNATTIIGLGGFVIMGPDATVGQTWTTGAGVNNISRMKFKTSSNSQPDDIIVSVYTDATKAVKVGETTNIRLISTYYWEAIFTPALSVSPSTLYYVELTTEGTKIKVLGLTGSRSSHGGVLYQNGVASPTLSDLYMVTYYDQLAPTGILSQHCFRSSTGDIPLIAHGTDLYKLSGASTTRTTDTEAEFNAGTLTDVVVLSDVAIPTAPTINGTGGAGSWSGDFYGKVTFVDASGAESEQSLASSKLTLFSIKGIVWTVPVDSTPGSTIMQRKLYRTKANGSVYYLVAILDDNTTTNYYDYIADSSLTVQYSATGRVNLSQGDDKNTAAIIAQTSRNNTTAVTPSMAIGQTLTVPPGQRKIYSIAPYLSGFGAADSITLTLYTDATKATTLSTATVTGVHTDGFIEFALDADVTPGAVYYFELSSSVAGISVGVDWIGSQVYNKGNIYFNGVSDSRYDMAFYVYGCKYETGSYESEVIDLSTAPTIATLTFSNTLNGGTIAWFARCSRDNVVWGDWQAVILSGDGMPLGRYIQIKAILTAASAGIISPAVTDYMISYNTGYGTATSIKGSLSGSRIRFIDWDDRVWFCDGTKNWVYDGGFVIAPETVPTVAASGSGAITGVYGCKVAYVNSDGTEGLPCTAVEVTASSSLQFDWSDIPTALGYTRKLYRTKAGGTIYYLVATLNATDTTYTDTTADASLTTAIETHTGHNVLEIGTSPAAGCSKPPASTIIHIHKNYALYVEAATGRMYVAKVDDPHSIPSASYFQFPSMPLSVKTYSDYLLVSGKDYTWYTAGEIFDVDPAVGDWAWKVVSSTIGCVSHESMIECLDSADNEIIIFPLTSGIKYLNANLMGTDLHSVPLSRNVQPYFDQAISREKMSAIFWNQAYYIAFNWSNPETTAGNHNNAVFKLDLRNREWSGLWGMDITGFFIANGDLYMTSSTCGRVYKYSGSDDDGLPIDMIVDSRYVGDAKRRKYPRLIPRVKRGCDTSDTTILARCDDDEYTIALGTNTTWAGAGGSERTVQDEVVGPKFKVRLRKGYNFGFRFEDNSINDMVLYGVTVLTKQID